MDKIVLIFFSKDRAMQLDAAICSLRSCCIDLQSTTKYVIYKTTSEQHKSQYLILQEENRDFHFIEETRVIPQILELMSGSDFTTFHCDDNLYIRNFSFCEACNVLSQNETILAHSLRLGLSIKYCYTLDKMQIFPKLIYGEHSSCSPDFSIYFDWTKESYDFGYPFEVSASVYRTKQIMPMFDANRGAKVTTIETFLEKNKSHFYHCKHLSCGILPTIVNVPLNRVGHYPNRVGKEFQYSVENLSEKFFKGFRILTEEYKGCYSTSPHEELNFIFGEKKCHPDLTTGIV